MDNCFVVYMHTAPNGKRYIGQTCQEVQHRWGGNGDGYKRQPRFYKAICKYGWGNFDHEIIAKGLTKEEAARMEQFLISEFGTMDVERGYNDSAGGVSGVFGHRHTDETRKKISEGHKNPSRETRAKMSNRWRGTKNPRSRAVLQFAKDGEFIRGWDCITDAARELNLSITHISDACRGYTRTHGGFMWKYTDLAGSDMGGDTENEKVLQPRDGGNVGNT